MIPLWAKLVGSVAILAGLYGYAHHQGRVSGKASEHALWVADTQARDKATADAIAKAQAQADAARQHNTEVESEYQSKLAAVAASRDQYVGLLQRARGEVRSVTAHEATSALIAATTGEADRAERIERSIERVERATERVVPEATSTADQLDALIAVVKPQSE